MKDAQGRKIICGKCGSGMIYRDAVPGLTDDAGLACLACGNREGSQYGFKKKARTEEGKDMVPRINGTCSNCQRPDMMLEQASKRCGSCQAVIAGVVDRAEREKLLARKAADLQAKGGKNFGTGKLRGKRKSPGFVKFKESPVRLFKNIPKEQVVPPSDIPNPIFFRGIALQFKAEDELLYDLLCNQAKSQRRHVDQQAMWILLNALERERGILQEASPAI